MASIPSGKVVAGARVIANVRNRAVQTISPDTGLHVYRDRAVSITAGRCAAVALPPPHEESRSLRGRLLHSSSIK